MTVGMYLACVQEKCGYFFRQIAVLNDRFDFRGDFFLVSLCRPQCFTNALVIDVGKPFRQASASIQDHGGLFVIVKMSNQRGLGKHGVQGSAQDGCSALLTSSSFLASEHSLSIAPKFG